jgi:hypothetical protein
MPKPVVDQKLRRDALTMVLQHQGLEQDDVVRFEATFSPEPYGLAPKCFVIRVDYSVTRGGGYQIFEGILNYKVASISAVCGRNRATPRFPLRPTHPAQTIEQLEEEARVLKLRLDYADSLHNDRES